MKTQPGVNSNQTDVTILVSCPVGSKTLVCGFGVVIRLAGWGVRQRRSADLPGSVGASCVVVGEGEE